MTALYGLVLAGGRSTRMRRDKAALDYGGRPQLELAYSLARAHACFAFISVRPDQVTDPLRAALPCIVDDGTAEGPIAGIVAAQAAHPGAAWLVLACDLPFMNAATVAALLRGRNPARLATAYRSVHDGRPEPLCAVYEPASRGPILDYLASGQSCPRKFLTGADVELLELPDPRALDNVNTPEEFADARRTLAARPGS